MENFIKTYKELCEKKKEQYPDYVKNTMMKV